MSGEIRARGASGPTARCACSTSGPTANGPAAPQVAPPQAEPVASAEPVAPPEAGIPAEAAAPEPGAEQPPAGVGIAPDAAAVAQPLPLPIHATRLAVTGGPAALTFSDATDELFVADRSALVWRLQHGEPSLARPFTVSGEPVGLAFEPDGRRLFVAMRSPPSIAVLDATTGKQLSATQLPADPGDIRLDAAAGLLFVVLPARDALQVIDAHDLRTVRITPELPRVTAMALDESAHVLYLSLLDGHVSIVDSKSGKVSANLPLGSGGLAGLAVANGQLYATNSPGRTLVQVDLATRATSTTHLNIEPGAVVVAPNTGTLYVLAVDANAVVKLDPAGTELSRTALSDNTPAVVSELRPESAWLRPRMAISVARDRVYVIEPEANTLAIAPADF